MRGMASSRRVVWGLFWFAVCFLPCTGWCWDVVINEIMYHPSSLTTEDEYIELLNRGTAPVSLKGWKITDGVDFNFPAISLQPGQYLVVAANLTSFTLKYPGVTNVVGKWCGHLDNQSERIEIEDSLGNQVDEVRYADSGDWAQREEGPLSYGHRGWVWSDAHDSGGKSLELINPNMPNQYGQNWAAGTANQGTPGAANSVASVNAAPLILDVSLQPILPRSTQSVAVTARLLDEAGAPTAVTAHYRKDGAVSFLATPMRDDGLSSDGLAGDGVYGAILPPQANGSVVELYIEARDIVNNTRTYPAPSLVGGLPQQVTNLLYLVDDTVVGVSTSLVAAGATWRYNDTNPALPASWTSQTFDDAAWPSSPARLGYGGDGEVTTLGYGPDANNKYIAYYFRHSFTVADASAFSGLTLHLLRDDGAAVYLNGTEVFRSNLPGTLGDGTLTPATRASTTVSGAGETTFYSTAIPPALLHNGLNVLAVEVHQDLPTSSDAGFDLKLEGVVALGESEPWPQGMQPLYHLIMTNAERQELVAIGDGTDPPGVTNERYSAAPMNGTFISRDEEGIKARYNVGVRNRGEGTSGNPPNNYHVSFRADRAWNGVTGINLNSKYGHLQLLGSLLFDASGVAHENARAAQVRVNGANLATSGNVMYGSYCLVEARDSDFVENHFPDDPGGNLYRATWSNYNADLRYLGENPASYAPYYLKETNQDENDWRDFIELTRVLNNTPDSQYVSEARRLVNVEQWMEYFALNTLLTNNETCLGTGYGDDYGVYRGLLDRRFVLLHHDNDTILGKGDNPGSATAGIFRARNTATVNRFFQRPEFMPIYYRKLLQFMETSFAAHNFDRLVDGAIGSYVPAPEVAAIKQFQLNRNAYVRSQIPTELTVECGLPTVGGYYQTTTSTVSTIYGNAPVAETVSITVNGAVAEQWDPFTGNWSLSAGAGGTTEEIVPRGSVWKYNDTGTDLGTAWRAVSYPAASAWPSGPARLGYGGDGEATTIGYGPDGNNKHPTAYFRHEFTVADASLYSELRVNLTRDDGAVVYLNGQEVVRSNMPAAPAVITYSTWASTTVSGSDETRFFNYTVPASHLVNGLNVLAVEAHQINATSSDLGMDLELLGVRPFVGGGRSITLSPGFNTVWVRTYDGTNGTGRQLQLKTIAIWYDTGATGSTTGGTLTGNTTLTAAGGPWRVTSDLIVPSGVTLTIQPGSVLYFAGGTRLIVQSGGRLLCEGTETQRIRLTYNPAAQAAWGGVQFNGTMTDNRVTYTDEDYSDSGSQAMLITASKVLLDNMTFTDAAHVILKCDHSNLLVRHCLFPSGHGSEIVEGTGIPMGGYVIFDGNHFLPTVGYNDIIDWVQADRPEGALQFCNNVFAGGTDEALDMDSCDAQIEGNVFMNFHQDVPRESSSNAISTGLDGSTTTTLMIARNVFINNDHDVLLKEGAFAMIQHNDFCGAWIASINFDEANRTVSHTGLPVVNGLGADIDGNIFWNMNAVFQNQFSTRSGRAPIIRANRNILPPEHHALGVGNVAADPLFTSPIMRDFRLAQGSPAIGTGPNGRDMGALVSAWANISGEPAPVTSRRDITLSVGGAGIVAYRYRVNTGPYSAEVPTSSPLQLTSLADGTYTVYVIGKNYADVWQDQATPTASKTWQVISAGTQGQLRVTELMYNPPAPSAQEILAGFQDKDDFEFVELWNTGGQDLDLTNVTLSGGVSFAFAQHTVLAPGEYLLLVKNLAAFQARYGTGLPVAGEYTGSLKNSGEELRIQGPGGEPLVEFEYSDGRGWPLPADGAGHSLVPLAAAMDAQSSGSLYYGGNWRASTLIKGSPGLSDPAPLVPVKLNEIAAHTDYAVPPYDSNDWLELYNPAASAVALYDCYLSDDPNNLRKWAIPNGTAIPARGFRTFDEIHDFHNPITAGFGLSKIGEQALLSYMPGTSQDRVVDCIRFEGQENGTSLGRFADGDTYWYPMPLTPGAENVTPRSDLVISEIMYRPDDDTTATEYIEILNPTTRTITLSNPAGSWRLAGGVDYVFPSGASIPPGGYALVVAFDPSDAAALYLFRSKWALRDIVNPVYGPYSGSLSNRGERIALERPQPPDLLMDPISWVIADEVIYFDQAPFTPDADGTGMSLTRIAAAQSGNDPANWLAAAPTPNATPPALAPSVRNLAPVNVGAVSATLKGEVTSTGGLDPLVRIYWGGADGGTDPSAWEHCEVLGVFGTGEFSRGIADLLPLKQYFFRAYVANGAGGAWAGGTATFATTPLTHRWTGVLGWQAY